jgi:hypothetical protein
MTRRPQGESNSYLQIENLTSEPLDDGGKFGLQGQRIPEKTLLYLAPTDKSGESSVVPTGDGAPMLFTPRALGSRLT